MEISSITVSKMRFVDFVPRGLEEQHKLKYLYDHASCDFIEELIQFVQPVKVYHYRGKHYPIESLELLRFLQKNAPDKELQILEVRKVSCREDIERAICQSQFFQNLSNTDRKILYGLEMVWKDTYERSPLLTQKQHAEMFNIHRASLNRGAQLLRVRSNVQKGGTGGTNKVGQPFSWADYTRHIPPMSQGE